MDSPEGIKYVDMGGNDHGFYNPANKTIYLASRYNGKGIPRGLLGEEVRHFLDDVELGVNSTDLVKRARFVDQRLPIPKDLSSLSATTTYKIDMWHHRRVYSRIIRDIDDAVRDPIMTMILHPDDAPDVIFVYRNVSHGRMTLTDFMDQVDNGWYGGPF